MGRRPTGIGTIAHEDPAQLAADRSQAETDVSNVQKLAMQAYLEARQREDLRRGLASRLMPTDGPFHIGDQVNYWRQDPSRIKPGVKLCVWATVQTVGLSGSMAIVDAGAAIVRASQTKLRKDVDNMS